MFEIIKYHIKNVKNGLFIEYLRRTITKVHFRIIKISTANLEYLTRLKTSFLSAKNFTNKNLNNSTIDKYLRLSNTNFKILYIIPFFILFKLLTTFCSYKKLAISKH